MSRPVIKFRLAEWLQPALYQMAILHYQGHIGKDTLAEIAHLLIHEAVRVSQPRFVKGEAEGE